MDYEFLPHTADAKFKAYGKTLEQAFSNAALALTSVMFDPKKVKASVKKSMTVVSEDEQALLYDFLEQFIILVETEHFLLNNVTKIKIEKDENLTLTAEIIGDDNLDKYALDKTLKAVTYKDMEVKKEAKQYILQVVLDI